jgi:diadenosine tetraphosphate (Ap4A) HIT family hydrolase
VAAAQTGTHNPKRSSYGHAMVVDPWGSIIAQCSDQIGFAIAQIDFEFLQNVRKKLPVWTDRKPQLYGNIIPAQDFQNLSIDSEQTFKFGPTAKVHSSQVFYRTQHTIAFVNHRPVLPGHVLVAPIREAKRLRHLNSDEITDLFLTVQKVQKIIESEFSASASTVAIQDGIDAGQSIEHLHVHLLPRKPTDFGGKIDQIYIHLQKHDKEEHSKNFRLKTNHEMAFEASKLRKYFPN